ncbi:hypothetical protein E2C01_082968 [Portunus trituberculatus]|uniref:Uncharacterized protein n=1 Tax=Portunus trituberculatus TaxID=210409 RepID=A0A5B7J562_PORTR|nr:hypothetical protein [Portunus trituberculatus]
MNKRRIIQVPAVSAPERFPRAAAAPYWRLHFALSPAPPLLAPAAGVETGPSLQQAQKTCPQRDVFPKFCQRDITVTQTIEQRSATAIYHSLLFPRCWAGLTCCHAQADKTPKVACREER